MRCHDATTWDRPAFGDAGGDRPQTGPGFPRVTSVFPGREGAVRPPGGGCEADAAIVGAVVFVILFLYVCKGRIGLAF